jgi:hypothetical protein
MSLSTTHVFIKSKATLMQDMNSFFSMSLLYYRVSQYHLPLLIVFLHTFKFNLYRHRRHQELPIDNKNHIMHFDPGTIFLPFPPTIPPQHFSTIAIGILASYTQRSRAIYVFCLEIGREGIA